jgi:DNA polymerase III subunit epsilon
MRHVCLDTETTGFDPAKGDRLCEIACMELVNYLPTGKEFHAYVNPNKAMPQGAFNVHGLSDEFLKDKPLFIQIADDFLNFIQDSPLVIHNAAFDMKFLNAELRWAKKPLIETNEIIDTLLIARKKFPGSPATLDALCKRFDISLADRTKHGALIDTQLLAEVYLNLCDGRSPSLGFDSQTITFEKTTQTNNITTTQTVSLSRKIDLGHTATEEEKATHAEFVKKFKQKSLWLND